MSSDNENVFETAAIAYPMIRVRDLDASLAFYTKALGMRLVRREDFPEGCFTLAFVGYDVQGVEQPVTIELTHNWSREQPYSHGSGFGHIAIRVPNVYAATARLAEEGIKIIRPAGPMKSGTEVIAFVEDPDGYRVELVTAHHFPDEHQ